MIVEEAAEYLHAMHEHGLAPVFLAAPTSPDARLQAIAEHSRGFVYAISRVGITGARAELADDARSLVERLRRFTHLPIALGFGVSTPAHVEAVNAFADAAVVGSALVALVEQTPASQAAEAVGAFVRGLKGRAFSDKTPQLAAAHNAAHIAPGTEAGSVSGEAPTPEPAARAAASP